MNPLSSWRTWTGLLTSVLIAATGLALIALRWDPCTEFGGCALFFGVASVVYLPYALLAAVLIGLPTHMCFLRLGLHRWWLYAAAGIAIGATVAWVVRLPIYGDGMSAAHFALAGASATTAFWLVTRRGNDP